jgi:hypothetical protein
MRKHEDDGMAYVKSKIDTEGFYYAFVYATDFRHVKDERFHELRENFLKAERELKAYVNDKAMEEEKETENK